MIPFLLSFQAIYSLIPIILIVLLIAGAAGLMRGADMFSFLGFGAVLGFTKGTAGRGSIAKKKYMGGSKARGRLRGKGTLFGEKGSIAKLTGNAKKVAGRFNTSKRKQQFNAMRKMKGSASSGIGTGIGGAGSTVGNAAGSAGSKQASKSSRTATPLNAQIMRSMRERRGTSLNQKIDRLNANMRSANSNLKLAKAEESSGNIPKFKMAKGIIFKTQMKNGKVTGYKPIFPVYKGKTVKEIHPLAFVWPIGGLAEGTVKLYTKIRGISPSYKRKVGDKYGSLILESEGLKNERTYLKQKKHATTIKKFKNEKILEMGKGEFNRRWKDALKESNEENTSNISNLANAITGFRDYSIATKKRAAQRGGNVLSAPGSGAPSWIARSAYNMDVSGDKFRRRIDELNSDIDKYKAARAGTKNVIEKLAWNKQIKAANAEKDYAQKIVNIVDRGSQSTAGLVTSSFKLALVGRMYGPSVAKVQDEADKWKKRNELTTKTCSKCGAPNNGKAHSCIRCGAAL